MDRIIEDLAGENKYKLSEAVGYFFYKIINLIDEEKRNNVDYINARIFTGALAIAYKVNPEELFEYFMNYEICQRF